MLKMKKIMEEMDWDEFYFRYTHNFEEFNFKYRNWIITLCYGKKGTFAYNIVADKKVIEYKEYSSPFELLKNARFNNFKLNEIYDELY